MEANYNIHEEMYVEARNKGWSGWGGDKRIANAGELVSRFLGVDFSLPKGKLLELGCGEGSHSRLFSAKGYEVTGVDVSETAIHWAREKSDALGVPGTFIIADLTSFDLKLPEMYDIVVDGNCLHCIIDTHRHNFLKNVHKSLRANGVFFISSLCSKSDVSKVIERDGIPYRHVTSVEALLKELEDVGFRVIKMVVHERSEQNHVNIHAIIRE